MRPWSTLGRLRREESGFTLPEVLVAMVMMVTVLFALYSIFDMSLRVFSFGNDKVEAVENARAGLERMEREIRAAYPQDEVLLTTWQEQEIAFGNNLDENDEITCPDSDDEDCEYITYKLNCSDPPDRLLRINAAEVYQCGSGGPEDKGDPVAENVDGASGLEFKYFDENMSPIVPDSGSENRKRVEVVRIKLAVEKQGQQEATQTLTTDVHLRNRSND